MKKFTSLVLLALGCFSTASAQWNTGNSPKLFFNAANQGDYYGCSPKAVRTSDGKTWISYKIWDSRQVNDSVWDFRGVHTYLQLLNANGVKQFADPGILVNDYRTPSWWSGYGLAVDAEGNAIVTVADGRGANIAEDSVIDSYSDVQTFQPAIYKFNQDGDPLWGLDGITFSDLQNEPFTDVTMVGDDAYFVMNGDGGYVMRVNADGTCAWDAPKPFYGQICPSTGTDFINFADTGDGPTATRYTRDLEPVWTVTYDTLSVSSHDMHPYKIAPDGEGGAAVAFTCNMGQFAHNIRVQHISGDGETTFGMAGVYAYESLDYDHDYPDIAVNTEKQQICVNWEDNIDDLMTQSAKAYNYYGDVIFGGSLGTHVAEKTSTGGYASSTIGSGALPNGDWIIVYGNWEGWTDRSIIVRRINGETGERVWSRTFGRSIQMDDENVIVEPDFTYVIYRNGVDGKQGIYGFRVSNADGAYTDIQSVSSKTTQAHPVAYYGVDGKQLSAPGAGLNIVKYSDGTVKKVMK